MTPGPGSYRAPSDFGHYESKNAKQIETVQKRRLSMEAKKTEL